MKVLIEETDNALIFTINKQSEWKQLKLDLQPPKKQWITLTNEEIDDMWHRTSPYYNENDFATLIEQKLKDKNYEQ